MTEKQALTGETLIKMFYEDEERLLYLAQTGLLAQKTKGKRGLLFCDVQDSFLANTGKEKQLAIQWIWLQGEAFDGLLAACKQVHPEFLAYLKRHDQYLNLCIKSLANNGREALFFNAMTWAKIADCLVSDPKSKRYGFPVKQKVTRAEVIKTVKESALFMQLNSLHPKMAGRNLDLWLDECFRQNIPVAVNTNPHFICHELKAVLAKHQEMIMTINC